MRSVRWLSAVAVACCLGAGAGACGDAEEPTRAGLTDALVKSGLSRDQAGCASDKVFGVLDPAARRRLAEQGASGLGTEDATALNSALASCRSVSGG